MMFGTFINWVGIAQKNAAQIGCFKTANDYDYPFLGPTFCHIWCRHPPFSSMPPWVVLRQRRLGREGVPNQNWLYPQGKTSSNPTIDIHKMYILQLLYDMCLSLSIYIYLHAHSYARVSLCTLRFDMNRHRQRRWISRCFVSGTSATAADLCRCAPLEGPKFHRESWDAKSLVYPVDMLCLPRDMEQNPPGDKDSRDNLGMFPKGYDQFKPLMGDITQFPFQCEK